MTQEEGGGGLYGVKEIPDASLADDDVAHAIKLAIHALKERRP